MILRRVVKRCFLGKPGQNQTCFGLSQKRAFVRRRRTRERGYQSHRLAGAQRLVRGRTAAGGAAVLDAGEPDSVMTVHSASLMQGPQLAAAWPQKLAPLVVLKQ